MTLLDMSTGQHRTRPADLLDGHTPPFRGCPVQLSSPARVSSQRENEGVRPEGETLTLRGGFDVSVAVIRLALRLEAAGVPLVLDAAGQLQPLRPGDIPTAERRLVARYWGQIMRLTRYCAGLSSITPAPGSAEEIQRETSCNSLQIHDVGTLRPWASQRGYGAPRLSTF